MPNLVGIGNSQVPTNAMLGGLAYQEDSVGEVVIEKIKAKTSDTAVDILYMIQVKILMVVHGEREQFKIHLGTMKPKCNIEVPERISISCSDCF